MRNEQGSATVLTLALALIICCAGMVSLLFVQLTLARSTLGSYADLAAIAAVQTAGAQFKVHLIELIYFDPNKSELHPLKLSYFQD